MNSRYCVHSGFSTTLLKTDLLELHSFLILFKSQFFVLSFITSYDFEKVNARFLVELRQSFVYVSCWRLSFNECFFLGVKRDDLTHRRSLPY